MLFILNQNHLQQMVTMYLHRLIYSLASVWLISADGELCNSTEYFKVYPTLFEKLGLLEKKNVMIRPLTERNKPTSVFVDLYVTSITNVNEKAQSISTQVRLLTYWFTEISWNSSEFCNIDQFVTTKDLFWTPDTVVLESIKTEFAAIEPPYVRLYSSGMMDMLDFLSLATTCKMDLHSFPFDTQICSLTLRSLVHSDGELIFTESLPQQYLTLESQQIFQTQGEWELIDINTSTANSYAMWVSQSRRIFQITIKRRPLQYIITLIFPVFCFLVLDVATFFIKASASEKLGFKVTLLLSISVLLLILNDKLPSTASDIPLIGIYCIGVFTLIGISILETIFVNVLICNGQDTKSKTPATGQDGSVRDLNNSLDTVTRGYEEVTCILDILKLILMEFRAVTQQHQPKESLCWIRAARIIDVTFSVIYIITSVVFLYLLGKVWIVL